MKLTKEQVAALNRKIPKAMLKDKPGAAKLTSINPIAVVDRLNEVFGVGGWKFYCVEVDKIEETAKDRSGAEYVKRMPIVKGVFEVPEYDIHLESYGGNDNKDFGDAYKGSQTDALTKIGSYLGIGAGIWRGEYDHTTPDEPTAKDQVTIALNFMATNAKALEFYCKHFGVQTIDDFSDAQLLAIYKNLKDNKKI